MKIEQYKKDTRSFIIVLLILIVVSLYASSQGFAKMAGSPHDFSNLYIIGAHAGGEICKACHVPHNAGESQPPLWLAKFRTKGTYTLYQSDSLNATPSQPTAASKACLSCHDGTLTKDISFNCFACHNDGGAPLNLSNHHPISFTYDTALAAADGALHDPSSQTVPQLGGKTIRQGMLYQDRMECISCHDVHATKGDSSSTDKLLLVANGKSRLCLTCHAK